MRRIRRLPLGSWQCCDQLAMPAVDLGRRCGDGYVILRVRVYSDLGHGICVSADWLLGASLGFVMCPSCVAMTDGQL